MNTEATPIFKYIGGKTWMKNHLRQELEHVLSGTKISTYVEPFSGGLGAFFGVYDILLKNKIKRIILNDINSVLIDFYKMVQLDPMYTYESFVSIEDQFAKLIPNQIKNGDVLSKEEIKVLLKDAESFYIKVREDFNIEKDNVKKGILLMFLQKHCFNGVYRENSKGHYNTPFNWSGSVSNKEDLKERLLTAQMVFNSFETEFSHVSFDKMEYSKDNVYYLDPPYINDDIAENKYNKNIFTFREQKLLIEKIASVSFIYSNHFSPILMEEFYKYELDLFIRKIKRKNIISSSASSRKNDKEEILITNKIKN